MRIAILCTGEELLDGRVLNTNAHVISDILFKAGFSVQTVITIGDDPEAIKQAFVDAIARHDVVISTGGLGPTEDDRTVACLSDVIQDPLILDEGALQDIESYYKNAKRPMPESNIKQAYIPSQAAVMSNRYGTAPAFRVTFQKTHIIVLPGVPREMKPLMQTEVLSFLRTQYKAKKPFIHTFKCFGLGESVIADQLKTLYPLPHGISIAFQVPLPEVHVRVMGPSGSVHGNVLVQYIREALGDYCYSETDASFFETVVHRLKEQGATLSVAESCTGGLLSASLTAISGASAVFDRSIVTYSNRAKVSELGVSEATLSHHGAVSPQVAEQMAEGIRAKSKTTYGISITGIAGPEGGTEDKPVGTVVTAIAGPEGTQHIQHHLSGDRERIQKIASYRAVWPLLEKLR